MIAVVSLGTDIGGSFGLERAPGTFTGSGAMVPNVEGERIATDHLASGLGLMRQQVEAWRM